MKLDSYFTNVHMDFHTPTLQRDIGRDFEPERFADRLVENEVDSIAFFAKGHHGNSYYDTDVGKVHPHLERNLLKEVVEACHAEDIKVLAYYTLVWDNYLEEDYPDWVQRDKTGNILKSENLVEMGEKRTWTYLCLNSPYPEEKIYPQIREIVDLGADGFFFDILMYHSDACTCQYCQKEMRARGLDPESDEDLAELRKFSTLNFAEEATSFIKGLDRDLIVTYNHKEQPGYTAKLQKYSDYLLIESLPGNWGYQHTPYMARYVRTLDTPFQGQTGIFHRSWGDFGTVKHQRQLDYEIATSLSHGAMISIGDHVLPRGELEKTKYDNIGNTFKFAKEANEQLGAEPIADVAVIAEDGYDPSCNATDPSVIGASKALIESHILFDIIDSSSIDNLGEYEALILPSSQTLNEEFARSTDSYVRSGGNLIVAHTGGLTGDKFQLDSLGVKYHAVSPYSFSYLNLPEDLSENAPEGPMVSYNSMIQVHPESARVTGTATVPATERYSDRGFSHRQAPPENDSPYPALTENSYGDGKAIFVAAPIFKDFYQEDYYGHRVLAENLVESCLPTSRTVITNAPPNVEITFLQKGKRKILNLVNFSAKRPGNTEPQIEEASSVKRIELQVALDKKPASVEAKPAEELVEWSMSEDRLVLRIEELTTHSSIVIEE